MLYVKKWKENIINKQQNKKMLQKKHAKTMKIFLKKKKSNASMPIIDTESFLHKMNLVKMKKIEKLQYARNLYNNIYKEKEKATITNICVKTVESFPKNKKTKA